MRLQYRFTSWSSKYNFSKYLKRFQHKENIYFLEIGSFEGDSTNYLIDNFLSGNGCTITCIDPWIKYSESTINKISGVDDFINENTYEIFLNNIKYNKNKIIIKRGLSNNVLPNLKQKYHFIYIDGDHSASAVWLDATMSFKILISGGIMIFDDYHWGIEKKLRIKLFGKIIINRLPRNSIDRFIKKCKTRMMEIFYQEYYYSLPQYAINRFIKEYQYKIKILSIDQYQAVIQKI